MAQLAPVGTVLSLERKAYDAIKEAILSFQLKPGMALVEVELARQLQISKTPVRDALARLELEGLVTKEPYRGTTVCLLSRRNMVEMFQIRAALEGLAVRLACANFSADNIFEAQALISRQHTAIESGDQDMAAAANRRFHDLFISRANNQWLIRTLNNLEDHLRRYRTLSLHQENRQERSLEEHRVVVEAISQRNADAAEHAMRAHLLTTVEELSDKDFDELVKRVVSELSPDD